MKIHFYSISNDEKVNFISDAVFDENKYMFIDKSHENTMLHIETISNDTIKLNRIGDVNMDILFINGEKTTGNYQNSIGFSMEFEVITNEIRLEDGKITIYYDLLLEGILENSYKIYLLIK